MPDKTDRLLKQMTQKVTPIGTFSSGEPIQLPNTSAKGSVKLGADVVFSTDGTDVFLKNGATTILTIILTTGNMTLGGTQKRVICTKVVGA